MQILIAAVITAVAAIQTSSLNARVTRSDPVLVRYVVDGDTIDVVSFGRVRLLGIDAPELGRGYDTSAPFGREALRLHDEVRLDESRPEEDGVFVPGRQPVELTLVGA